MTTEEQYTKDRQRMVDTQLRPRGVSDPNVLAVMQTVPRHRFVDLHEGGFLGKHPYGDYPLPIGEGQTISQPYIVAYMSEQLQVIPQMRVLEIGTGCGYQTAVLCELGATVFSVERIARLSHQAKEILTQLGYTPTLCVGDGYNGLPDHAPFDAIICAAAAPLIPPALEAQLAQGGTLVIPVGEQYQQLKTYQKEDGTLKETNSLAVRFVPMVEGTQQ